MLKDLLKRLNVSPKFEDYREVRFQMIDIAEQIAILGIEIARMKEEYKIADADITQELKS
jgi:hypothetical protein